MMSFFSLTSLARNDVLILTLNGSNDVCYLKDGPLGGQGDGLPHFVNRQFQAKMPK